jgi:hypothetical protein
VRPPLSSALNKAYVVRSAVCMCDPLQPLVLKYCLFSYEASRELCTDDTRHVRVNGRGRQRDARQSGGSLAKKRERNCGTSTVSAHWI